MRVVFQQLEAFANDARRLATIRFLGGLQQQDQHPVRWVNERRFLNGIEPIFQMASFIPSTLLAHRLQVRVYLDGAVRKRQPPLDPHQPISLHFVRRRIRGDGRIF